MPCGVVDLVGPFWLFLWAFLLFFVFLLAISGYFLIIAGYLWMILDGIWRPRMILEEVRMPYMITTALTDLN